MALAEVALVEDEPIEERHPQLKVFKELNDEAAAQKFRLPWSRRVPIIRSQFPSTVELDWYEAFRRDHDLFVRIMQDIIKAEQAEPGRDGPRPKSIDYDRGIETYRRMMAQDYSTLPFNEAFTVLTRGLSLTQIARKTEISRSAVHRLMRGDEEPTGEEMESVARAFKKHPSFFAEYRAAWITAMVHQRMEGNPETSIAIYRKMVDL